MVLAKRGDSRVNEVAQDLGVGSHVAVLSAAIARTTGPILECGLGHWSTPLIHLMANGERHIISLETDVKWLEKFLHLERAWHQFRTIYGENQKEQIQAWIEYAQALEDCVFANGVVFLDQSPGEARVPMAMALKGKALYIICHDTCADIPPGGGNYGWAQLDGVFKYAVTYADLRPTTTVYSDEVEFAL